MNQGEAERVIQLHLFSESEGEPRWRKSLYLAQKIRTALKLHICHNLTNYGCLKHIITLQTSEFSIRCLLPNPPDCLFITTFVRNSLFL